MLINTPAEMLEFHSVCINIAIVPQTTTTIKVKKTTNEFDSHSS
jgi:hypothetical protein